ncbi:tail fiber assembly protein [Thalassospira profundimaris]|uniref:Tail fiber assembly protein n=1 Tax=Thalassospira profundimaris TaxID=502049 RepID=A0A367W4C2_9PROT|nr:tail fiber assembly protein [Thalassospira profundimaris]
MLFGWLKKKDRKQTAAFELYTAMVTQARQPDFYAKLGVPDTLEGRFDLILVHAFVLFRRLKAENGDKDLAQAIFDVMFADLDQNMREMGIGDVGILKRIRKMSESYHGRIVAYEEGVQSGAAELAAALNRNLFADTTATDEQLMAMVGYVNDALAVLSKQAILDLQNGKVHFPNAPKLAVAAPQ